VQAGKARVAALIALTVRHHGPDAPGLPGLRRPLAELRIEEIADLVTAARVDLPDPDQVRLALRQARRALGPDGGEAA
jgi:hypothetical protein